MHAGKNPYDVQRAESHVCDFWTSFPTDKKVFGVAARDHRLRRWCNIGGGLPPPDLWPVLFVTLAVFIWLTDGIATAPFGGLFTAAGIGWLFGFGYFLGVCLSKIKSEHIRGAIRPGLGGKEYALPSSRCAIGARPYPRPSAYASHYSSERKISESAQMRLA
jgi:hypothetical protein